MPTMTSNRKFGVEIEFVGISMRKAIQVVSTCGVSFSHELSANYNHHDSTQHWKVVSDGSVDGPAGGGEVVSPILSGAEGLEQIQKVCDALSAAACCFGVTNCVWRPIHQLPPAPHQ